MRKEVTICDCCGKEIDSDYTNIHFQGLRGKPIYQDQSFIDFDYDFCHICAKNFPKMFKEFIEYKKKLLEKKK